MATEAERRLFTFYSNNVLSFPVPPLPQWGLCGSHSSLISPEGCTPSLFPGTEDIGDIWTLGASFIPSLVDCACPFHLGNSFAHIFQQGEGPPWPVRHLSWARKTRRIFLLHPMRTEGLPQTPWHRLSFADPRLTAVVATRQVPSSVVRAAFCCISQQFHVTNGMEHLLYAKQCIRTGRCAKTDKL